MAKRRSRLASALSGLGIGISNASQQYLRQHLQEQTQDRFDARQLAAADRQFVAAVNQGVAKGEIDPVQASSMLAARGITADPSSFETVRPPLRNRLDALLGTDIAEATSPEMVPSTEMITGAGRREGAFLPADLMVSGAAADDPFAGARSELLDYQQQAETKRKALREQPTERLEIVDPATGIPSVQFVSRYGSPVQVGPSATQKGVLGGEEIAANLGVSGPAKAAQAALEAKGTAQATQDVEYSPEGISGAARKAGATAQATQDVALSPEAQEARTREAVDKELRMLTATLPRKIELAREQAKIDIQQAVGKDNAINLNASVRAQESLKPFFQKVTALTDRLNRYESGLFARGAGAVQTAQYYAGGSPDLRELEQVIAQNARQLAIAMGVREANVSEKETAQALAGIGLSAWATREERRNALRNLQDLIDLGPVVAARMGGGEGITARMTTAADLIRQRREVEQAAIKAGAVSYIDPVTGGVIPVIQ